MRRLLTEATATVTAYEAKCHDHPEYHSIWHVEAIRAAEDADTHQEFAGPTHHIYFVTHKVRL